MSENQLSRADLFNLTFLLISMNFVWIYLKFSSLWYARIVDNPEIPDMKPATIGELVDFSSLDTSLCVFR